MAPTPKPTALLKLHGSKWGKYSRSKDEPKPAEERPKTTIKLNRAERRVFNQIADLVKGMGMQANTDGNAIARYAAAVTKWNSIKAFLDKHGDTYGVYDTLPDGRKGELKYTRRMPESIIANELETTCLRLEKEFGLTPSSRAGLVTETRSAESDLAQRYFG